MAVAPKRTGQKHKPATPVVLTERLSPATENYLLCLYKMSEDLEFPHGHSIGRLFETDTCDRDVHSVKDWESDGFFSGTESGVCIRCDHVESRNTRAGGGGT